MPASHRGQLLPTPSPVCREYRAAVARAGRCAARCADPTPASEVLSRLPVLRARGQSPEWDAYLESVYGEADPPSYPVDLTRLGWLYYDRLPIAVVPVQRSAQHCPAVYGHAWTSQLACPFPTSRIGAFGALIQHYDSTAGRLKGLTTLEGARRPSSRGAANGSWVEVARTVTNHPLELCSSWYFHAPGSGVWWNVGKSYVAKPAEDENLWFPLPPPQQNTQTGKMERRHTIASCRASEPLQRLVREGYESLQMPDTTSVVRSNHFELVDLRHWKFRGAKSAIACGRRGEYRSGFHAQQPCTCQYSEAKSLDVGIIGCRELPMRNCSTQAALGGNAGGYSVEREERKSRPATEPREAQSRAWARPLTSFLGEP